jgi:hypothetical protein
VDVDNLLDELFDPELTASDPAPPPARYRDEAACFAALVESRWLSGLHALADKPALQQHYGFSAADFSAFVSELALGSSRLGVRARMEEAMRAAAAYANISPERLVWKQASLAAAIINAYVDFLGYNPRELTEQERSIRGRDRAIVLFADAAPVGAYPELPDRGSVVSWKQDWLRAVAGCIAANVDFDGQRSLNVEQNRIVGDIIHFFAEEA